MSDTDKGAAAAGASGQPFFAIERIYTKDISLECPRGLEAFKSWSPTINLDINTKQTNLQDGVHEVVLTLTIRVLEKETESTYFLVELQQAGLFRTANIEEQELRRVLATVAPATLFPYARETVDTLVIKAGFPPLRLAPINFEALLKAAVDKQQSAAKGRATIQ